MKIYKNPTPSTVLRVVVSFAAISLLLLACGPAGDSVTRISDNRVGTTTTMASGITTAQPGEEAVALDVSQRPDMARQFWAAKAIPGAIEAERFESLEEMAASSDVVVIARLSELVDGPTVKLDEGEDAVTEYTLRSYRLEITEVLSEGWDGSEIEIHFAVMPESFDAADIGEAILFLRSGQTETEQGAKLGPNADWFISRYRLISSQGVFIATPDGLANPLSEVQNEGDDPISAAWEGRSPTELMNALP